MHRLSIRRRMFSYFSDVICSLLISVGLFNLLFVIAGILIGYIAFNLELFLNNSWSYLNLLWKFIESSMLNALFFTLSFSSLIVASNEIFNKLAMCAFFLLNSFGINSFEVTSGWTEFSAAYFAVFVCFSAAYLYRRMKSYLYSKGLFTSYTRS